MGHYSYDAQLERCQACGKRLKGRQERYCSKSCINAAYRAAQREELRKRLGAPAEVPCALCGAPISWAPGRPVCDYLEEAGPECQEMQDARQEARIPFDPYTAGCENCGRPVSWSGRGRLKRFCTSRCTKAFARAATKRGAENASN